MHRPSAESGGRTISDDECERLWAGWTPSEVAHRLSQVTAPWYIAAGWALDLFTGSESRKHADIEIGVPHDRFDHIVAALPEFEWDVVDDGRLWPYPKRADQTHQTWLRDPTTGYYHLDVFREPRTDDHRWTCRRDPELTLTYDELILHTREGIPYVIPEVALLFKAKYARAKDEQDFHRVIPMLHGDRLTQLSKWLTRIHPGHPWIETIGTFTQPT